MDDCINASSENEFYIIAFSMPLVSQLELFFSILLIYLMAVLGNLIIIFLVCLVPKLHTQMYFFLCNLAILDVASTSTSIPKILSITLTQNHRISFSCCIPRCIFFILFADGETLFLTAMAYDRYVAICKPLQYYTIMSKNVYITIYAFYWLFGALNSLLYALILSGLQFCYSHEINNFFCDLNTMISISSTNTTISRVFMFFKVVIIGIAQLLLIIISYIFIFSTILKIHSSEGRKKAFSSCTSHLITVILFHSPIIILYVKPESEDTKGHDKFMSMHYLVVVPMLNPLVYSRRNKDVWEAIVTIIKYIKVKGENLYFFS